MTTINEIDRIVVEFASLLSDDSHYPLSRESQIWLVCESAGPNAAPIWKTISRIDWKYSQICTICDKQAVEAEFKERLINGKIMKAEDYIGAWRVASKAPVPMSHLQMRHLVLIATVSHSTKGLQEKLATEDADTVSEALASEFLLEQTDELTTWSIPLTSLGNIWLYYKFAGIWISKEDYPEETVNAIKVVATGIGHGASVPNVPFDLFECEGAAA